MLRKPLNKIRYPFLRGPFTENPLPFKKLNRKGVELRNLSNKRGLSEKIRKIEKNIIKQEKQFAVTKIKNTYKTQSTVHDVSLPKQIYNFIKPSFLHRFFLRLTKKKTNTVEKKKARLVKIGDFKSQQLAQPLLLKSSILKARTRKSKYMFSLLQLKTEFSRKQTQHNKSSVFKILLEERKKCSIAYGCLNKKQMQKIFLQAKRFQGKFDENFVKIVESRLDVALFRLCFFPTLFSARQWVNHGHILVNNSVINLPGYQLKGGDIITVAPDKINVLKRAISLFIAEKIKIRACHYLVKINLFYGIIKSCIPCQKIKPLLDLPSRISIGKAFAKKGYAHQKQTKIRKILLSFKKSFQNIVGKNTNKEEYRDKTSSLSHYSFAKRNAQGVLKAHRIERFPLFFLLTKAFLFFSKKEEQLLPFLKVRNLFTSARPLRQRVAAFKISGMKPLNLEVCYKKMVAIFLYSPQKVALPVSIDLHLIAKSIQ